jgi:hypothetical protein
MTVINAWAHQKGACAYLLTDGAIYNPFGTITGFASKTCTLPHFGMAIAVTGTLDATAIIARKLKTFSEYDSAIEGIASVLREAYEEGEFISGCDHPDIDEFRLIIAGWCESKRRPEVFAISSTDEPCCPAFTRTTQNILMSPGIAQEDLARAGLLDDGKIRATDDPADCLTRMIDIQRRTRWESGNFIVGGCAVLTKIDAGGITQRVVRRWADRVDEKIDPFKDAAASDQVQSRSEPPENLSRVRRQMLEKKAKKALRRMLSE